MDFDIVEFLTELRRRHGAAPSYTQLYRRVAAGELPAQRVRGRWVLPESSITVAAEIFGLQVGKRS